MTAFVWTILILLVLEIAAKLACLAGDRFPARTKGTVAFDVFAGIGLVIWAAILLAKA